MNCEQAIERLQQRLDNGRPVDEADLHAHLAQCSECRGRFAAAEVMLKVFPRANLADRVMVAVRCDTRDRWMMRWGTMTAIAAGLLAAILISQSAPVAPTNEPVPSLERQLATAGSSMWHWTEQTAKSIPVPRLPNMPSGDTLVAALEPAAAELAEAGRGLASAFGPLTESTMRAASRFRHDLPID